uniref:WD_REPEATS_REGION domain-containing protein n=1 Tax=Panagrolaimus sp. ES5 TaxID=591445 RepID=A0AC34GRG1_9BILA
MDANFGGSSTVDIEKAIDNCKSLEDAKFLCKRLAQLSIEQGLTAVKAEQSTKMLTGELEYVKKNFVEADDIVHSFMETNDDRDNTLSPVENVSNRQSKVRQKTGTSNDLLFPGTIMNDTITLSGPGSDADNKSFEIKSIKKETRSFGGPGGDADNKSFEIKPIKKEPKSSRQEKSQSKNTAREALKEMNGDNTLTEQDDDDTLDSASISEPIEKTQQFYRYSADKVVKYANVFEGHSSAVHSLSASEDRLVSGSKDRKAFVWDLNTGKKCMELPGHPTTIRAIKIVPQSNLIITGSAFHMRLWDARTGKCEILFQASGLVTDSYENNGRRTFIPPGEDEIRAFDVDSTGQYLFSNSKGSVRCWDFRKQQAYGRISGDDAFPITSISVQSAEDASGRVQIFCGHSGTNMEEKGMVSICKTPLGHVTSELPTRLPFEHAVTDVIPDGKVFFNVARYSTIDHIRETIIPRNSVTQANKLCFVRSPITNGSLLAAGFQDGIIKFFDYEGRQGLKNEGKMRADMNKILAMTSNSKQFFFTSGKEISVFKIVYNPS